MSWKFLQIGAPNTPRSPKVVTEVYKQVAKLNAEIRRFTEKIRIVPIITIEEAKISIGVMDDGRIVVPKTMAGTPKLTETDEREGDEYQNFPLIRRQEEIGYQAGYQSGDLNITAEEESEAAGSADDDFYRLGGQETPTTEQKRKLNLYIYT